MRPEISWIVREASDSQLLRGPPEGKQGPAQDWEQQLEEPETKTRPQGALQEAGLVLRT